MDQYVHITVDLKRKLNFTDCIGFFSLYKIYILGWGGRLFFQFSTLLLRNHRGGRDERPHWTGRSILLAPESGGGRGSSLVVSCMTGWICTHCFDEVHQCRQDTGVTLAFLGGESEVLMLRMIIVRIC
jgi:hypothetical protein